LLIKPDILTCYEHRGVWSGTGGSRLKTTMKQIALAVMLAGVILAQEGPKFEVASIKPSDPNANGSMVQNSPGGRVRMTNTTLKNLIANAYEVRFFQVTGGPEWADSARFDIEAKGEAGAKQKDFAPMLRALLKERFQLVVRRETKEMPIYALVLARKDGKLGPQMKETTCQVYDAEHPPPTPKPGEMRPMGCGGGSMGPGRLRESGAQVANLALSLSGLDDRVVLDQTGLKGKYDISLDWTPDNRRADDNAGPSLFTALQEQLGLKLESAKGPVDMIVIEKAEKPTEN